MKETNRMGECAKEINLLLSISIDVKRMIKKLSQLLTKQNAIVTTAIRMNMMTAHTAAAPATATIEKIFPIQTHIISNAMFTVQTQILHAQRVYIIQIPSMRVNSYTFLDF